MEAIDKTTGSKSPASGLEMAFLEFRAKLPLQIEVCGVKGLSDPQTCPVRRIRVGSSNRTTEEEWAAG